ncbi:hypothetical protein [Lactovum odontotermitis]
MKKKKHSFSAEYDSLFENPVITPRNPLKMRILITVGVIVIGLAAVAPSLFSYLSIQTASSLMEHAQKKLDALENDLPYTETNILRSNVYLDKKPNYTNAQNYHFTLSDSGIDFGNGYILNVKDSLGLNSEYSYPELKVKPTPDDIYSGNDDLAQYSFEDNDSYAGSFNVNSVFISGNLISDFEIQVDKSKGSWAKVLQTNTTLPAVKTGYVFNYRPATTKDNTVDSKNYLTVDRYWIFPDGVGIYIFASAFPDQDLDKKEFSKISFDEQLNLINKATNNSFSTIINNFELVKK